LIPDARYEILALMADKTEKRATAATKLSFRVFINVGIVWFLDAYFPEFFILQGGTQAIAIAGLILTFLNWIVVPLLHVLSLPIKMIAWMVAFLLVNAGALWLTVFLIESLDVSGVSLAIGGGAVGWVLVSVILGIGNWLVRAILK
jgi:putative membrane protein